MTGPAQPPHQPAFDGIDDMNSPYALDKSNAKLLGVCAGLARMTGWDPLAIRLGAVAATLLLFGPFGILLYILCALLAESR